MFHWLAHTEHSSARDEADRRQLLQWVTAAPAPDATGPTLAAAVLALCGCPAAAAGGSGAAGAAGAAAAPESMFAGAAAAAAVREEVDEWCGPSDEIERQQLGLLDLIHGAWRLIMIIWPHCQS